MGRSVDADQRDAVGKQKVAMSGGPRLERSARECRVGFGTPGMAALMDVAVYSQVMPGSAMRKRADTLSAPQRAG